MSAQTIYSIGHSTRDIQTFADLLEQYHVDLLVDIRSYPTSRHCPHFNQEAMRSWLPEYGIAYTHLPDLGGRRTKSSVSLELIGGWTHPSFRNYAAYMQSAYFKRGLAQLIDLASSHTAAYMCSEAVWWRCHRRMVSDALSFHGLDIEHIMDRGLSRHQPTSFAETNGETVIYPGQPALQLTAEANAL